MISYKDEDQLFSHVIGYMLKVMKSGKRITNYRSEFNAIRHGDYDAFFTLVKEPQSSIVQWKLGEVKMSDFSHVSGDCDVTMILAIGPSLKKFITDCHGYYGDINDPDITNIIFRKCAAYEIALRAQLNKEKQNRRINQTKLNLKVVINELSGFINLSQDETKILHDGREFLNMVKGHEPFHFNSLNDGIIAFYNAWNICDKHNLKAFQ